MATAANLCNRSLRGTTLLGVALAAVCGTFTGIHWNTFPQVGRRWLSVSGSTGAC
jgi:hypothetical protein